MIASQHRPRALVDGKGHDAICTKCRRVAKTIYGIMCWWTGEVYASGRECGTEPMPTAALYNEQPKRPMIGYRPRQQQAPRGRPRIDFRADRTPTDEDTGLDEVG